jgi:hypothetical protein
MAVYSTDVTIDNVPLPVDGSGVTQPVSAVSLPLPTGAATSANQVTMEASLSSIDGKLTSPIAVTGGSVASATVTRVAVSTSVVTLLSARAARQQVVVFNEAGTLFVKAGATASSTDYTWRLTANAELDISGYTGIITAIKASGATNAQVSDF